MLNGFNGHARPKIGRQTFNIILIYYTGNIRASYIHDCFKIWYNNKLV